MKAGAGSLMRVLLAATVLCMAGTAGAAGDFTIAPVTLQIPAGFEGPISGSMSGVKSTAFRKPHLSDSNATLLQVTTYDLGEQGRNLSEQDRADGAEQYLKQFLGGIERRRSDFSSAPVQHLRISGIPTAQVRWNGRLDGMDTVGLMYCLIVGSQVVSLHTQDSGSTPSPAMLAAQKAIESLRAAQ